MYDQTGSTEDNPYAGFENQDIFSQFRGGGFGGRGTGNMSQEDLENIFAQMFGGAFEGGNKRGKRRGAGGIGEYHP